jgi:hypothetical protein
MRYAVLMFTSLPLLGCSILEDEVAKGYAQKDSLTPATFTTADIRIITQRINPVTHALVMCTEPSPDVAKALSTAAQLSASGGNAGTTGNFAGGGASAEAVEALAGRSTALLGLRDGMYRACEAYANGAIGADAYALVLSRYGQLMTTLFLGQDITGAAGTVAGPSVQSPPVTVNVSATGGVTAGQPQNPPNPAAQPSVTPAPSNAANSPGTVALTRMNEDYLNLDYGLGPIVIACINEGDPTRLEGGNTWLKVICPELAHVKTFIELSNLAGALVKHQVLASPVNPAVVVPQPAQNKQSAKSETPSPSKSTSDQIKAVQTKLKDVCTDIVIDGKFGPLMADCVKAYQSAHKLTPSGTLDPATLDALGVPMK